MTTNLNTLIGTNLELFGSEFEKKIKKASADCESAWNSLNMTQPQLYIWRVEKFKLVAVKQDMYGGFYEGDSYVIFNIYLDSNDALRYNIHFWLGNKTTQDEMGTAAYKTVELDTFLNDRAVQYREIQNSESDLFRSYFPQGITYKEGGIESGFTKINEVNYDNYVPLLYKIHNNSVIQMPLNLCNITDNDVFVLDTGSVVYIYEGELSSHKERYLAQYTSINIKNNRKQCTISNTQNDSTYNLFIDHIKNNVNNVNNLVIQKKLMKINEINDNVIVVEINGQITYKLFDTNDAYVFNTCHTTYIWIGRKSNYNELLNAWKIAFRITNITDSIVLVKEGLEPEIFKMNF